MNYVTPAVLEDMPMHESDSLLYVRMIIECDACKKHVSCIRSPYKGGWDSRVTMA